MDLEEQVFQSLVEHYEETGDAMSHIQYLIDYGLTADIITDVYHKFHDWIEEGAKHD